MRKLVLCLMVVAALWAPAAAAPQVPLCMIGDSITWAQEGDWWRAHLLELRPNLAFVGTHSALLGYSHAGEGGNGTGQVLARLADLPDCPNYHLLIGTNNTGVKDANLIEARAAATAADVLKIVAALRGRANSPRVFLGSILPCFTDNPLRDQCNHRVNEILREKLAASPDPQVTWIEYEQPIRAIPNWQPMIRLHPTKEGYRVLAKLLDAALQKALNLPEQADPWTPPAGAGVRVVNLAEPQGEGWVTSRPIIAGWYTLSLTVKSLTGAPAQVTIATADKTAKAQLAMAFGLPAGSAGKRLSFEVMPGYEGYGYTRSRLSIAATNAVIEQVLFEKKRPGGKPSVYGTGSYLDRTTVPAAGELVEP